MPYLDSVEELLEAKEGEHVQFKEAKNRFDFGEAARCCCALANDGGGKLVFGISDKRPRSVVGSRAFEQPERARMGLIDKLKINVDFQLFTYEEKRVLVFDVKSRPIGLPILYGGQIQVLMRELRDSRKVVCKGKTSAARQFAVE